MAALPLSGTVSRASYEWNSETRIKQKVWAFLCCRTSPLTRLIGILLHLLLLLVAVVDAAFVLQLKETWSNEDFEDSCLAACSLDEPNG